MPIIGLKNELDNKQLKIISSSGLASNNLAIDMVKGKKMSPVGSAFFILYSKRKEEIIDEKFSWIAIIDLLNFH
jgi:hypothetical protein